MAGWKPAPPSGGPISLLKIGELAEQVGLSLRTIRFYEEEGLVVPEGRTSGGFRLYSVVAVNRLELIKRMKPLGFTVEEMVAVLTDLDSLGTKPVGTSVEATLAERLGGYGERLETEATKLQAHAARGRELASYLLRHHRTGETASERKRIPDNTTTTVEGGPVAPVGGDASASTMDVLAHTSTRLAKIDSRNDLLEAVTAAASRLLRADAVHLGAVDRRSGALHLIVDVGTVAEWEMTLPTSERQLFAEYPKLVDAGESGAVWRVGVDDADISDYNRSLLLSLGATQGMSLPVRVGGDVCGELFFSRLHAGAFSDEEESAALVLTGLLGAGLARLDGVERLVDLAYTDALTGLGNRRLADEQLQEWAADPHSRGLIAVALCDANDLKSVNDELGHPTGDRLLSELGRVVRFASHRLPHGIAARIGGDEFLLAGLCDEDTQLREVVADLTVASRSLPLGSGLSCGTAWSGSMAQAVVSPAEHVSALLRLADVSQYEHKRSRRRASALTTPHRSEVGGEVEGDADGGRRFAGPTSEALADHVTRLLRRVRETRSRASLDQLVDVSATLCELSGAAAWWVSSIDPVDGAIVTRTCGTPRDDDHSDGQWPAVVVDPTTYALADYPATAAIVDAGGSFAVDTYVGDPAERHLLVQTGFSSMVAASTTDAWGLAWLVEIYGDALTRDLQRLRPLLEASMVAALPPAKLPASTT